MRRIPASSGSRSSGSFVLALPVATVTWTVVHEEIFREAREYCVERSKSCRTVVQRKFFYVFTCEYCFSHYITAIFLVLTRYRLLLDDWRGYVLSLFAIVGLANAYMSLFGRLRVDIKSERLDIAVKEEEIGEAQRIDEVRSGPRPAGTKVKGGLESRSR